MPYRKTYKKTFKRRPFKSQAKRVQRMMGEQPSMVERIARGTGAVAGLAKAMVPLVTALNTEEKFLDTKTSVSPGLATASFLNLTQISQGVDENNRVGNSIKARGLQIRARVYGNFTSVNRQLVRMMLIADKAINAATGVAAATLTSLFQDSTTILSPINKDQGDRFVIIKDKFINLNLSATGGADSRIMKFYKNLDFHIRYAASAATDAAPGAIYLVLWSDASVNPPTVDIYTRFKFTDN